MPVDLPKEQHELDQIFKTAKVPEPAEFNGEYFVDMLTGLPTSRMFMHRKVFYSKNGKVTGHNLFLSGLGWGSFYLEEGLCENYGSLKAVIINYGVPKNSFITNKIRDYIRCIEKNRLYLGRFNYLFMRQIRFLGYFSLKRRKNTG